MKIHTVRLILGDQLNARHSWFRQKNSGTLYVMMELRQETDYVVHHRQKVLAFFSAMRAFADALEAAGHQVHYITLDDDRNQHSLTQNLLNIMEEYDTSMLECQQPDEYRLDHQLKSWAGAHNLSLSWFDSEHFLTGRNSLKDYFPDSDNYLMETFYRKVRKKYDILMEAGRPLGGRWNFDKENQKKIPEHQEVEPPLLLANDTSDIDTLLRKCEIKTMGQANPRQLMWPVNRKQSKQLLEHFCRFGLPNFGRYQDTMATPNNFKKSYWSLYHSRLSFSLNTKMLHPLEVVETAIEAWSKNQENISLAQIEGFCRQIIGWREFVRGIYWAHMPDYKHLNELKHHNDLPEFYWTGDTKMNCLHHSITQSLKYAYAHHIQRLMVTGNFALLAGVSPDALDDWYLGIYIDAIEWVELPNTRGMSQYADGGLIATKPYIASANYMQKMGHYCKECYYDPKKKTGDNACPFNSLYWHFIERHKERFKDNHRMSMMYKVWQQKTQEQQQALMEQAELYLNCINDL
ncbi:cryptochrome/photolyase family protein [Idiomarina sp. HP20-50]|uniref:cryptochrome/photolyase family protein n=1 Tax=Idiomarina sp. HP20-50 TaxID=3070813 RepID=UPI00294ACB5E|nr:cryptochrome/photolyase family protein [Idiomarina sp. HP20-50]MDV6315803.1 cryptochrome/photolyase family protein [Idiomarina sp. HP20-50]